MWPEIAAFLCILFTILLSLPCIRRSQDGAHKLPPGPRGLLLLGHLHLLGSLPHHSLHKLSQIHGPIMYLRLGLIPTIVFSSPEYAEIFLKTHDSIFASRPLMLAGKFLSYGQKNLIFAQYGSYWRNIRKLCTMELLNSSKIESFMSMRYEEVCNFVEILKKLGGDVEVDLTAKIYLVIEDMTYRMILGSKDRYNFKSTLHEIGGLAGLVNVSDYIPFLAPLDLQGIGRQLKATSKALDEVLEKIIEEHAANDKQQENKDFIDVMLSLMESNNTREFQLDRDNIKAIILDMLASSVDTSSTVIEWTIAEILKNPRVMKLLQKELEDVVGCARMVEETDLIKLDYLKMVIKETMRIHPVAPLLVPHESTEDITVNGYFIPKKSRVLVNTWSIGRDPNVWSENAEEFYPERFVGTNMDLEGHDFRFIPFGSGRRKCPGLQLGFTVVQLVVAQLVHCFDLELPNGMVSDDLDMDEKFGLTVPRANHLIAVPRYRLNPHPALIL